MINRIEKIVSELKEINENLRGEIATIGNVHDKRRSDLITYYYDIDSAIKFLGGIK